MQRSYGNSLRAVSRVMGRNNLYMFNDNYDKNMETNDIDVLDSMKAPGGVFFNFARTMLVKYHYFQVFLYITYELIL